MKNEKMRFQSCEVLKFSCCHREHGRRRRKGGRGDVPPPTFRVRGRDVVKSHGGKSKSKSESSSSKSKSKSKSKFIGCKSKSSSSPSPQVSLS